MEFNISHKVDPETKNFKVVIEGDKEFNDALNKSAILLNDLLHTFLKQLAGEILTKKKQKSLIPTEIHKKDEKLSDSKLK